LLKARSGYSLDCRQTSTVPAAEVEAIGLGLPRKDDLFFQRLPPFGRMLGNLGRSLGPIPLGGTAPVDQP